METYEFNNFSFDMSIKEKKIKIHFLKQENRIFNK